MSWFQGRKAASILLLAGAVALGIALLFQSSASMPLSEVKPRKLRRTLVNQGWVWIDPLRVVRCPVAGPITITKLLPEGTKVKKGDLVCELDASGSRCTIYAQADGPIVRAEEPQPNPGGHGLEEGATVQSWDKILSVFDVNGEIRVTTKVPKKMIERVHPGLQAQITLDAFPEKTLSGVVAEVFPLPDPSVGGTLVSVYTVRVKVDKGFPGIQPDMKAEVKIFLDGLDDVLSVPIQAVIHSDRMDLVAFQRADGGFTWRPVTLGVPTGEFVEVVHGLEGGELVALDPQALIREENQRGDFGTPSNPAKKQGPSRKPPSYSKTKKYSKYSRVMTRLPSASPPPPSR